MVQTPASQLAHLTRFATTLAVGKGAIVQAEHVAAGAAAGMSSTLFGFVVMPLVVGISGMLGQMEHQHYRDTLREEFREELAARTGKRPEQVSDRDLDLVARDNKALQRSLRNSRKERDDTIILSIISSVVSMAAVKALSGIGLLPDGLHEGVASMLTKVVAGVGTYLAVKRPLHWIVDKINGLEEPTVADKAMGLARAHAKGVTISQQKLFEVYMDANPELGDAIRQEYGRSYEKMNRRLRGIVVEEYGGMVGLPELTADINAGRVKPTEIAFAAYGQQSGVAPREPAESAASVKPHWMTRVLNYCGEKLHAWAPYHPHKQKRQSVDAEMHTGATLLEAAPLLDPPTKHEKAQMENAPQKSFVERVGRKRDAELPVSHVERLSQQQAETQPIVR